MANSETTPNLFDRGLIFAVFLLVVLASALAMAPSVADPDLWGHVQFGRDVIQTGQIAPTTSYSFTAEGFRWINHENLSEIAMAWTVDNFGNRGLLLGKFLLSIFVIGSVVLSNFSRKVGLVPTSILALLVAWNLGYHWSFRPQVSSFIMFTLMILVLQYCFSGWRDQWHWPLNRVFGGAGTADNDQIEQSWFQGVMLWLLFPIMVIWTNSHGGFVAGVCIVLAYLVLRAVEAVITKKREGLGLVRRMALIAGAVVAATLINPYSYRLPMWLIESLGSPRVEISDWSNGQLATLVGMKFWCLMGIALFSIGLTRKSHDFVQLAILGITLWQALTHFRHVPFFTLLCGFWLGPHLQSALNRIQNREEVFQSKLAVAGFKKQLAVALVMLLLIGGVCLQLKDRLSQIKVDRSVYPVEAMAFLKRRNINGNKVVVTYNWAQYAIAALCVPEADTTKSKLAFDGRFRTCYPQEIVDMHFDFLYGTEHLTHRHRSSKSGEIDPFSVLSYGQPDLAIVRREGEIAADVMRQVTDQWTLIYRDGLAEIWGLKSRFDDSASPDYLPVEQREISDSMPAGFVSWPALREQNSEDKNIALAKHLPNPAPH